VENIPLLPPRLVALVDYPSSRDAGTVRLGFLGRLVPQKNLRYLLESYRVLTQASAGDIRYELHFFGDGLQREELMRASADWGLPNVTFHGEMPREEISAAIDSCDLFVVTSLTEGQCIVALEVLSRGRPLVATPVGALPEVLAQAELGRLAPLGDAAKFAAAVREVVAAIRAREITPFSVVDAFRTKYDYDAVVKKYLALLTETTAHAEEN
jgi:glycosyltransferase involved in cell wall biosynthesis